MRHIATLVCGLFVIGSFAACGDDDDDTTDTEAPSTEAAVETEAPTETEAPVETEAPDETTIEDRAGGPAVRCGTPEATDDIPDVCATADAFTEAINTYDTEALLAVTTEDFTYQTTGDPFTRDEFIPYFDANYEKGDFAIEHGEELIVSAAGFVGAFAGEQQGEVTSADYNATGTSFYGIVDVDGTWLIEEFVWIEDG